MPKTLKNQYEKALSIEALEEAHKKCSKGKRLKKSTILFNLNREEYIKYLYENLKNMTYKHRGYNRFYVTKPKLREIDSAKYIDRVVHRWYVDYFIEPYFMPQFISTSYACLKGKGMHRASLKMKEILAHCHRIWGEYYIIKMDVTKYFKNIDKKILVKILQRKIKDEKVLWLTNEILASNEKEKGLPIGNYTSQSFANIYLNELDQFVKNELKLKYYVRYMDDFVIAVKTKEEARDKLTLVREFLQRELKLELNNKTQIFKNKQGVNFCGYKINENRMKVRDRGKRKLKDKIKMLKYEIRNGKMTSKEAKRYLCGHIGYINIADTYNLTQKLFFNVV
jgi:hypothetical protein